MSYDPTTNPSVPARTPIITDLIPDNPGELAFTGSSTMLLLLIAAMLITIGFALIENTRTPRRYGAK